MLLDYKDFWLLKQMLGEIQYVEKLTKNVPCDKFMEDEQMQRATSMTLINIGELSSKLSKEVKQKNKHIPFAQIINLRHLAAHEYHNVNFEDVWFITQNKIPNLKKDIEKLI